MRKFIHIDMDCFYAAVEMRDNPALRDIPIAIGGRAEGRGVISTCNYPARRFGVRSAMATAYALRLCPDLVLVRGRMDVYKAESAKLRKIFADYTDQIEPLSLDEAYLDVTDTTLHGGSATLIAQEIRQRIERELNLTASAGVAPIKFVAKIASDENKPNGICVVAPEQVDEFVRKLPLKKIPGVGKVTQQRLARLGLSTCADVRNYPQNQLEQTLGKFGKVLWNRAHGIDERRLTMDRPRKSIGVERTLAQDITSFAECEEELDKLIPELLRRFERAAASNTNMRIKSLGVKLKFADFQQTTVEHKANQIHRDTLLTLLGEAMGRARERSIRLVGVVVGLEYFTQQVQLPLQLDHG